MSLTLEKLTEYCRDAAAVRRVARLQPAGGAGDKLYPPTYEGGQYALDTRVIDGARVPCALMDSVQSQANRMELALLAAHRAGKIEIPVVSVNFGDELPDIGTITSLEAPHRLADAILRDSDLDGTPFRQTPHGQLLDTATIANATGIFGLCPTALIFGLWDSAGPRRGLGTKFARALVSEVIAVDVEVGVRPASRIDPLGIQKDSALIYEAKTPGEWTMEPQLAAVDAKTKKPKLIGKEGKPSEINHGNVTPSLTNNKGPNHGGVTFAYARQTAVLSLPALRKLHFPDKAGTTTAPRDLAAQAVLTALSLTAISLTVAQGLDLRSRCLLVPEAAAAFEVVGANGDLTTFTINVDEACLLLRAAVKQAVSLGLPWLGGGVNLKPRANFVELVRRSRALAMSTGTED